MSRLLHVIYKHLCIRCTPQSVAVCAVNGTANGIVVNYGYESGWISLVSNYNSIACKEFELSVETEHVFALIQQIVKTAGLTNVNLCLYFIGGNLKDDLIHKLKQSYNKSKDYMKYINKVVYNSNPNVTLSAGAEYANSLKFDLPYFANMSLGLRKSDTAVIRRFSPSQFNQFKELLRFFSDNSFELYLYLLNFIYTYIFTLLHYLDFPQHQW